MNGPPVSWFLRFTVFVVVVGDQEWIPSMSYLVTDSDGQHNFLCQINADTDMPKSRHGHAQELGILR